VKLAAHWHFPLGVVVGAALAAGGSRLVARSRHADVAPVGMTCTPNVVRAPDAPMPGLRKPARGLKDGRRGHYPPPMLAAVPTEPYPR
jgi:hypothetical protein